MIIVKDGRRYGAFATKSSAMKYIRDTYVYGHESISKIYNHDYSYDFDDNVVDRQQADIEDRASIVCKDLAISLSDAYDLAKVCQSVSAIKLVVMATIMARQPLSVALSILEGAKI